jgi:hypothetical protein
MVAAGCGGTKASTPPSTTQTTRPSNRTHCERKEITMVAAREGVCTEGTTITVADEGH